MYVVVLDDNIYSLDSLHLAFFSNRDVSFQLACILKDRINLYFSILNYYFSLLILHRNEMK